MTDSAVHHIELDHVFVCVPPGAVREAEQLVQCGLREGPPNVHPGQGTANRRFSFRNAMLELIWVEDVGQAQSAQTAPTRLYERWSGRKSEAVCPFGIILRPTPGHNAAVPFPAWRYEPEWLPAELEIYVGNAGLEEPMWVYMPFLRRQDREGRFTEDQWHPNGVCEITRLMLMTPPSPQTHLRSSAAQIAEEAGVMGSRRGTDAAYTLAIEFDHGVRQQVMDLRPELPLVLEL
jgi:hypothetical protein